MAGITNPPFRQLCREYGGGLFVCEMITSRALVERNERTLRMVRFAAGESPRSVQLYGVDPRVVGEAVRMLVDEHGADHVDLNFGCPVPKVTRRGGGAALPYRRGLLRDILRSAVRAADGRVPVTMKMRIGISSDHITHLDAGRIAADEGVAALALHGRTAAQLYGGTADWSAIAALKEAVDIPVLGNGDIWEASDALRMVAETGCDGVVVGRGCLGRPWLFADLSAAFAGTASRVLPSLRVVCAVMLRHASLLGDHLGDDRGIRDFRKHIAWYLKGFAVGGPTRAALAQVSSLGE
ncbi:MAG: tRNA dihydrouridine synthase DusB, partial [Actinomycetota bacterium]|nr:tRNA dihydrouridine synthase DusB [Actinomycetota bacterium]